jgi:ribosome-associated translation inhibitor RaiA
MKLSVQQFNVHPLGAFEAWVKSQILALGQKRKIDEARVHLVRLMDTSPAFQVSVQLVTPGPDVFAEGRDHTLRAAFTKALAQLRDQITRRAAKQIQRAKRVARISTRNHQR